MLLIKLLILLCYFLYIILNKIVFIYRLCFVYQKYLFDLIFNLEYLNLILSEL